MAPAMPAKKPRTPTQQKPSVEQTMAFDALMGPGRGRAGAADEDAGRGLEPVHGGLAEAHQTDVPCAEATRLILSERRMSIRSLARLADLNQSHLSRALREQDGRYLSVDTVRAIGAALGQEPGFFPEDRAAAVHDAFSDYLQRNTQFRDELYEQLRSGRTWRLSTHD